MRITEVTGQITAAFLEWKGFFKDPNYCRVDSKIIWPNPQQIFHGQNVTRADIAELTRNRQFSFRVADDDSLVQIAYRFIQTGELVEARLAYFNYSVAEEITSTAEDTTVLPLVDEPDSTAMRWMRFDFVGQQTPTVLHPACHLHLSGHPGLRFAVAGVPTPRQFVELIVSHFYPAQYEVLRLDNGQFADVGRIDALNSLVTGVGTSPQEMFARIPHLRVPGM